MVFFLLLTINAAIITTLLPRPSFTLSYKSDVQLTRDIGEDLDPVFSPDGTLIAFASNRSGTFDIWLMTSDGRREMRLTSIQGDERFPKFSSDGKKIAFLTLLENKTDIWVCNIDGTNLIPITDDGALKEFFEWHPSNELIVYDSLKGGLWGIWIVDVNLHSSIKLADGKYPSWTSDGKSILFSSNSSGNWKIYLFDFETKRIKQLTFGPGNDIKPRMSPNGRYIAFVSDRNGKENLWIIDFNKNITFEALSKPLIQVPGVSWVPEVLKASSLVWSPTGIGIMFVSKDLDVFVYYLNVTVIEYQRSLGNVESVGNAMVRIVYSTYEDLFPSWKPDGKGVLYASNKTGNFDIWLLILETEVPKPYG